MSISNIIKKINELVEILRTFYDAYEGKGMYAGDKRELTPIFCDNPECGVEILEQSCFYSYDRRLIFHSGCGERYRLNISETNGPQHWTLFEIPRYRAIEFLKDNRLEQSISYQRRKIEKLRLEEKIEEE
jgi:hypothetical protein